MSKAVFIRTPLEEDLPAIVDIEDRNTGVSRKDYWKKRMEISEAIRPHWASLVAEADNRVVGFVFGRAGEMEFGLPGTVAWIEIIGVHPAYRGHGVGAKLLEQFAASAEEHGIETVFTLVSPANAEIRQFFLKQGFTEGTMSHFQKAIKS